MKRLIAISLIAFCGAPLFAAEKKVRKFKHGIKDQYIVRLADTLPAEQVRSLASGLSLQHAGRIGHVFSTLIPAFEVTLPEAAAEALSRHPLVEYVEQVVDSTVSQVQLDAPFHLDRIDHRLLSEVDGRYNMYCNSTPVYAYVVDTGIKADHVEFWMNSTNPTSRVIAGKNFADTGGDARALNPCSGNTWDFNTTPCARSDRYCVGGGHGTAVASVLGGRKWGVAKHVSFVAVRTHDCTGTSNSAKIARGLEWIYNDKPTRLLPSGLPAPAVVNLSFGVDVTKLTDPTQVSELTYMEEWITRLVTQRNITVVAAANNLDGDARNSSPARLARGNGGGVITVGGTTRTDRRWKCNPANTFETCSALNAGSNWGPAIDIFAPAQNISSAGIKQPGYRSSGTYTCCFDSTTAERQVFAGFEDRGWPIHRSGTSFAAPIVSGIAAIHLIGSGSQRTPLDIWNIIRTDASGDGGSFPPVMPATTDADSGPLNLSPNRFLYRQGSAICRF